MIRDAAAGRCELVTLERDDDAERIAKLADADAAIVASTRFTRPLIEAGRKLAFVHHQGVGYHDTIDTAALADRRIPLAITPGGTTVGVAEHTVMLILAMLRRLPFADAELRQGRFHVNALRPVSRELRCRRAAETLRRDAVLFRSDRLAGRGRGRARARAPQLRRGARRGRHRLAPS